MERQNNKIISSNEIDSNKNKLPLQKQIKTLCINTAIFFVIALTIYLIEKMIFRIMTKILITKLLSFPLLVLMHLLFLRYLIIQIIFPGQNYVLSKSFLYSHGLNKANPIYKSFTAFYKAFSILNNNSKISSLNIKSLTVIKKQIENIQSLINSEIDILNKIYNKFNSLSNDQQKYLNNLIILNDSLKEGNLLNIIIKAINLIKKYNSDLLSNCPDESKNEILSEFLKKNLTIQKILIRSYSIMNQIKDYLGNNGSSFSFRNIRNLFRNNLFASIEQFHCELNIYFTFEEKFFFTKDKNKLEYIIIKNTNNKETKKLMIICGPNGSPYQLFSRNSLFKCYLDKNIDILCWNYRGYGFSEGTPSYEKLRTDVLELFDEIKSSGKYENFAVHGISIGGIPCCHLARNRKEIELMVCDRNFGKLDNILQSYNHGKFLYVIYKLLCFQSTDNVENYLNTNCYKIILNDPQDNIVFETGSLKTLISAELCKKYFEYYDSDNKNTNFFITNNENLYGMNGELESLKSKNNSNNNNGQNKKINTNIIVTNYNKNINIKNTERFTALDKIFNCNEEKNKFINILLNISNIIREKKEKEKEDNSQYSNLKEEEKHSSIDQDIFLILDNNLIDIFDSLESAGDTFSSIFSIKWDYTKTLFIENFFNNLFIWGSKNNNNIEHSTKNIEIMFNRFIQLFDKFINSQDIKPYKGLNLIKDIECLYEYFYKIKSSLKFVGLNMKNFFIRLIDEKNNNGKDYEQCLMELNKGYFVNLKCGHNGILFHEELDMFQKYLTNSDFFMANRNNEIIENNLIEEIFENEKGKNQEDNDELNANSIDSDKNINEII